MRRLQGNRSLRLQATGDCLGGVNRGKFDRSMRASGEHGGEMRSHRALPIVWLETG